MQNPHVENLKKATILMLFMEPQWPATRLSLLSIMQTCPADSQVLVLLNGSTSKIIRNKIAEYFPDVKLYISEINLGVAGGRNFLLRTPEARAADYIFQLDNDIILSKGYFTGMISFLQARPDAGLVGPIIFRTDPSIQVFFQQICLQQGCMGVTGLGCSYLFDSDSIIQTWKLTGNPEIWHIGTNVDGYKAYCSELVRTLCKYDIELLTTIREKYALFRSNIGSAAIRQKVRGGAAELPTGNVPGGASLYRRDLIDEIGGYDEGFNPYQYEDCEFSLRAQKAGYRNYINPRIVLFHGTDFRNSDRDSYVALMKQTAKTRILIRRRVIEKPGLCVWSIALYLVRLLAASLIHSIKRLSFSAVSEAAIGAYQGMRSQKPDHSRFYDVED